VDLAAERASGGWQQCRGAGPRTCIYRTGHYRRLLHAG